MKKIHGRFLHALLALSVFITAALGSAQTEQTKQLALWEAGSNAISQRPTDPLALEHYEIPYDRIGKFLAKDVSEKTLDALLFEKEGRGYLRWIINPDDTKWHRELERWLASEGLSTVRHKRFVGRYSASRSLIVYDPETDAQFSAKVSTNNTGGNWKDKKQPIDDAFEARKASDFVAQIAKIGLFKHTVILEDEAQFSAPRVDQAMLIRELGEVAEGKKFYLPGFSALHEETGRQIAAQNGSSDPAAFWNEHYNKALARSLAELAAYTGLTFDSPHSQNFLIELDENRKPTGKIVLRDFGDTYLYKPYFEATGFEALSSAWTSENVKDYLVVGVGLLHGNKAPSWLSSEEYAEWGRQFYAAFEGEFAKVTGIPQGNLASQSGRIDRYNFSYHNKTYDKDVLNLKMSPFFASLREFFTFNGTSSYLRGVFAQKCDDLAHAGGF